MKKKFYITSAIPYVNAAPHIGHALEFVEADVIARFHRLLGEDVLLLSGGDENSLKNIQAAEKANVPIQQFIDEYTEKFLLLTKELGCQYDVWQKGSDTERHFASCQKLWNLCRTKGDIYKKTYEGLYCVGCEAFYTKDELNQNGECFEHPGKKLELVKEENWFFNLKKYEKQLIDLIKGKDPKNRLEIVPEKRKHEILSFLERGLTEISISRSNERAKNWGVPVPDDPTQRMYVWFDALNIYQSGVGFGWDDERYQKWWPCDVHVIGKGINRFHAVYWPAFLLSAGLSLPKKIFVHEYFTVNGQKMSKSLGNVIDPMELIRAYGAEPLRYFLLAAFSPFNDGDFSHEEFRKKYNADLAHGLGNLISRVAKLCDGEQFAPFDETAKRESDALLRFQISYEFDKALEMIWARIKMCDKYINDHAIWTLKGKEKTEALTYLVGEIRQIAYDLQPFLPQTSRTILTQYKGEQIQNGSPLFPRIEEKT